MIFMESLTSSEHPSETVETYVVLTCGFTLLLSIGKVLDSENKYINPGSHPKQ